MQALALDDTDVVVWFEMSQAAIRTGNLGIARRILEEGAKVDATYWPLIQSLCEVVHAIGDQEAFAPLAAYLLEHDPQCASVQLLVNPPVEIKKPTKPKPPPRRRRRGAKRAEPERPKTAAVVVVDRATQRARDRIDTLQAFASQANKKRKILEDKAVEQQERIVSTPIEYLLQERSWLSLGKLLLQAYDDITNEFKQDAAHVNVRIGLAPLAAGDDGKASASTTGETGEPTQDAPLIIILEDEEENEPAKKKKRRHSDPVKSNPVVVEIASDSDVQDNGGEAKTEQDISAPVRRKSRRHEERLREEHAAAMKIAREKDLAYRLQQFIPALASISNETQIQEDEAESVEVPSPKAWPAKTTVELRGHEFLIRDESRGHEKRVLAFPYRSSVNEDNSVNNLQRLNTVRNEANGELSSHEPENISSEQLNAFVEELGSFVTNNEARAEAILCTYLNQCGEWAEIKLGATKEPIQPVCLWAEKVINGQLETKQRHRRDMNTLVTTTVSIQSSNGCTRGLSLKAQLFLLELQFDHLLCHSPQNIKRSRRVRKLEALIGHAQRILVEICWQNDSFLDVEEDSTPTPTTIMVRILWLLARLNERAGYANIAKEFYTKCLDELQSQVLLFSTPPFVLLPNQTISSEITLPILSEKISGLQFSDISCDAHRYAACEQHDEVLSVLLNHFFPANQVPRLADLLHDFDSEIGDSTESSAPKGKLIHMMMDSFSKGTKYSARDAHMLLLTILGHVVTLVKEKPNKNDRPCDHHPIELYDHAIYAIQFILDALMARRDSVSEDDEDLWLILHACCVQCMEPSILLLFESPKDVFASLCKLLANASAELNVALKDAVARTLLLIRAGEGSDALAMSSGEQGAKKKPNHRRGRIRILVVELLRFLNWQAEESGESTQQIYFSSEKRSAIMLTSCKVMKEEEPTLLRTEDKVSRQLFGNCAILFLRLFAASVSESPEIEVDRITRLSLVSLLHQRLGRFGICALNFSDDGNAVNACFLETATSILSASVRDQPSTSRRHCSGSSGNESESEENPESEEEAVSDNTSLLDQAIAQCFRCLYDVQILSRCEDHKTGYSVTRLLKMNAVTKKAKIECLAKFAIPIFLHQQKTSNGQKKEHLKLLVTIRDALASDTTAKEPTHAHDAQREVLTSFLAPLDLLDWNGPIPIPTSHSDGDSASLNHLWYLLGENLVVPRARRRGNLSELVDMEQRMKARVAYLIKDVLYYYPDRVESWIRLGKTMKDLYHAATDASAAIVGRHKKVNVLELYAVKGVTKDTSTGESDEVSANIVASTPPSLSFKDVVTKTSIFERLNEWKSRDAAAQNTYRVTIGSAVKSEQDAPTAVNELSIEEYGLQYIVHIIEFARRCFAMAAKLAEQSLKLHSGPKKPSPKTEEHDIKEDEAVVGLRSQVIECHEECGLLLYNVLQEFSLLRHWGRETPLQAGPLYAHVIDEALQCFRKGLEWSNMDQDLYEERFRLNYMIGKTLKKQLRLEQRLCGNTKPTKANAEDIMTCFAQAEQEHEDGEMEHALVHAFYGLQAMRMELLLSENVTVAELRLVCDHYFVEEEDEEDDDEDEEDANDSAESQDEEEKDSKSTSKKEADTKATQYMSKEDVQAFLNGSAAEDLQIARAALFVNVVEALDSIPNEDRYFHPSRFILARGLYTMHLFFPESLAENEYMQKLSAVMQERPNASPSVATGPMSPAERALKELGPLFDKRRPQVVAIWLSESVPTTKKFEELNQRQMKYDRYRLKYWYYYVHLLEESEAYGRLKEVGSWVLACREDHDVIDEMLAVVLEARANILTPRLHRWMASDSSPSSETEVTNAMITAPQPLDGHVGTPIAPFAMLLKQLAKVYTFYLDLVDATSRFASVARELLYQRMLKDTEFLLVTLFLSGVLDSPAEFQGFTPETIDPEFIRSTATSFKARFIAQEVPHVILGTMGTTPTWRALVEAARGFCEDKWPERSSKKSTKTRARAKSATTTCSNAVAASGTSSATPITID